MKCYDSLTDITIKSPTALTIGKFEGMHKGHHLLISKIISKSGLSSCVITFKTPPRFLLSKDTTPSLFTNEEKEFMFKKYGINFLISCNFDKKFMEIEATKFIDILCKNLNMKYLVVGSGFTFGYKKEGNVKLLQELSAYYGFELDILEKMKNGEINISSTYIRKQIIQGNISLMNEMLGYEYFIICKMNKIESNNNIGQIMEITPSKDKLIPKMGNYIINIECNYTNFISICEINHENILKVYIFDCNSKELFKEDIKINFVQILGDDKIKFNSIDEIKRTINKILM